MGGDGIYHEAVNGLQLRWIRESGLDKNDSTIDLQPLPLPIGIIPAGNFLRNFIFFSTKE